MNLEDYEQLAAACDLLLRSTDTSLGRIALPLLHVINEHPGLLAAYQPLLATTVLPPDAVPSAGSTGAGPATIIRRAARALHRTVRDRQHSRTLPAPGQVDVLIVSHLNSAAQLDNEEDFYFGALQALLRERGATSLLALANHLPTPTSPVPRERAGQPGTRTVLPDSLPMAAEMRIWAQGAAAGSALLGAARRTPDPLGRTLADLAARQALAGGAVRNLRLHHCIANLCRQLSPRIVITTYEGDASERLVWHAARQGHRQPLCVGYQHTSLRAHAHAIRRRVNAPGLACDPDVVLTLGEITEAALAASAALQPLRLVTYGSHRRLSAPADVALTAREQACLVLPDADAAESAILFRFAIACAHRMPAMSFVLRPHPASRFDIESLRGLGGGALPGNVILSTQGSLAEHCLRVRCCLYRGSSAAMQAVLAGAKPLYLARPGEMSFDPLYQLDDWRETVATPAEFALRANAAYSADSEEARQARQFCDRYVSAVRPAAIDTLLELAAARTGGRTNVA